MQALLVKLFKIVFDKGPTSIATAGVGLIAGCGPLLALLLLEAVQFLQEKQQSETLQELATNLKKLTAREQLAADEIAGLEGIKIDDLPEGDLRVLHLVVHRFLRREFDASELREEQIAATLDRLSDDQKQRWNALLIREFPELKKMLELTHEDLAALVSEHNELRRTIEGKLDALVVAPPLEFSLRVAEKSMRFTYWANRTPHFGRDPEMAALETFLGPCASDAVDFRWWLWTGPGGAGKSRLAWELCLLAESQGWRVGFLEDDVDFDDWHRWHVDRKTLMVVDYCAKRPDQVRNAILGLTNHHDNIHKSVRILILERSADSQTDAWWSRFDQSGSTSRSAQLRQFAYWPDPAKERPVDLTRFARSLEPLGDDALWSIIATVFEEQGKQPPPRDDVISVLRQIDPQGRPLFALLASETLRERGLDAIRQWDASTLTESILKHEFARWRRECDVADGPSDEFERHLNLLAFVTIVGRQPFEITYRLAACGANVPRSGEDVQLAWWHSFLGYSSDSDRQQLAPFTPDILGELYVLLRLKGSLHAARNHLVGPSKDTLKLWEIAWSHFPLSAAMFLFRAAKDFPDDADLHKLTTSPEPKLFPNWPGSPEEHRVAAWLWVGSSHYFFLKNFVNAVAAFDLALELQPDSPFVVHLIRGLALEEQEKKDEAIAAYDRCLELKPDCISALLKRGNILLTRHKYDEAMGAFDRALSFDPDNLDIQIFRLFGLCVQGKFDEAHRALDCCLKVFPTDHPRVHLLSAAALLVRGAIHNHERKWDEAIVAYDRALALRPDFPEAHYVLALAAIRASDRYSQDVSRDDAARRVLRLRAYGHLKNALALQSNSLASTDTEIRLGVEREFERWQQDADLASVRDPRVLEELPEEEQQMWRDLWAGVAAVIERARRNPLDGRP